MTLRGEDKEDMEIEPGFGITETLGDSNKIRLGLSSPIGIQVEA